MKSKNLKNIIVIDQEPKSRQNILNIFEIFKITCIQKPSNMA